MNKTLTIVGKRGIMTSIIDARASKEVVGFKIRPNECWVGGSSVPLRALHLFNLPQVTNAYIGRERGEFVDRCLNRAGQVTLLFFSSL